MVLEEVVEFVNPYKKAEGMLLAEGRLVFENSLQPRRALLSYNKITVKVSSHSTPRGREDRLPNIHKIVSSRDHSKLEKGDLHASVTMYGDEIEKE